MTKPIDKSKKSNRKCYACVHFPKCSDYLDRQSGKNLFCGLAQKPVAYWNCCKHFTWNPDMTYTEGST